MGLAFVRFGLVEGTGASGGGEGEDGMRIGSALLGDNIPSLAKSLIDTAVFPDALVLEK